MPQPDTGIGEHPLGHLIDRILPSPRDLTSSGGLVDAMVAINSVVR